MISTRGRYALRSMIDIARYQKNGTVALKDISKREDISIKYLEQVIALLVKENLLTGTRGPKGGYRLSRELETYTIYDILKATEVSLASVACLQENCVPCERCTICTTRRFWEEFNDTLNTYLKSRTLKELVDNANNNIISDYVI